MANPRGIVLIGHGFVSEPKDDADTSTLSPADHDRIAEAVRIATDQGVGTIFFTEDVPYTHTLPHMTVAYCNHLVLRMALSSFTRYKLISGRSPYEHSWNTCRIARDRGMTHLTVIASFGYFEAFGRMWERAGERNGLHMTLVSARSHAGPTNEPVADTHDISSWDKALADMATAGGRFGHQLASLLAKLVIRDNVRV